MKEEHQFKIERYKLDIKNAESRLKQTKCDLEQGYKREQSKVEKVQCDLNIAKYEMEKEYSRLKEEVNRATNDLEKEKSYLRLTELEAEKGYTDNI